jgi:hypothetical protein
VVVPTRDRPDLLQFCLESLAAQTFEDVEVVVSDNAVRLPARDVFDRWAGSGWRYVRPKEPLPMHENFERACAEASGEYVGVVIDKTLLHRSALEHANCALMAAPADIVTWWSDGYTPLEEERDLGRGRFHPFVEIGRPTIYDPAAELATRFANPIRRGEDPIHYVRGKIVFGLYSSTLLNQIRARTGRIFYPLAPDYTSMVPASVFANRAIDLGRPLLLSYNSVRSNGRRQGIDPAYARRFIEAADPSIIDALPIPGLYTSMHNVVAYDLVSAAARCPAGSTPPLDLANLVRRAREDLASVAWADPDEKAHQYAMLETAEDRLRVPPETTGSRPRRSLRAVLLETIARFPRVERLAYEATGRMNPTYASPVEAARAADEYYSAKMAQPS